MNFYIQWVGFKLFFNIWPLLIQAFNFAVEINIFMVEIYSSLIDEKLEKMPVQSYQRNTNYNLSSNVATLMKAK